LAPKLKEILLNKFKNEEIKKEILVEQIYKHMEPDEVVVQNNDYTLLKSSFMRLRPGVWLNDEVMNAFICLVNHSDPS
jgi:Ulp1 family protease